MRNAKHQENQKRTQTYRNIIITSPSMKGVKLVSKKKLGISWGLVDTIRVFAISVLLGQFVSSVIVCESMKIITPISVIAWVMLLSIVTFALLVDKFIKISETEKVVAIISFGIGFVYNRNPILAYTMLIVFVILVFIYFLKKKGDKK